MNRERAVAYGPIHGQRRPAGRAPPMTWLDELLAGDVRWSDGGPVPLSVGDDRPARDVFDELAEEHTRLGPSRDVFDDLGDSLDRAAFVETPDFAPIEGSEADGEEPLVGLLGVGDPVDAFAAGLAPVTHAPHDDITSLSESAVTRDVAGDDETEVERVDHADDAGPAGEEDEYDRPAIAAEPTDDLVGDAVADVFETGRPTEPDRPLDDGLDEPDDDDGVLE